MWHIRFVASGMLIAAFVFLFGLIIGSFLNVCIVRIPGGKSIVMPASACPKCGAAIRPYDNIPVISYLLLGGKCRKCKNPISAMYPVVELLTGLLFLGCYEAFGLTAEALKWAIFSAIMVVLVFTDLRERILPDVVNFTGFGFGLLLSFFTTPVDGTALASQSGSSSFLLRRRCFRLRMRCSELRSAADCSGWSPKCISACAAAKAWAWAT